MPAMMPDAVHIDTDCFSGRKRSRVIAVMLHAQLHIVRASVVCVHL